MPHRDGLLGAALPGRDGAAVIPQEPSARRERVVLAWLRIAGKEGACVSDMPEVVAYTARNAISLLRRAGYTIRGERCRVHRHGRAQVERYWLERP